VRAAILNAIRDAIGVRIARLPATPDRIRQALSPKEPIDPKQAYEGK
jgi:CO/xanthine dehydrogenase Mo-binding subunit